MVRFAKSQVLAVFLASSLLGACERVGTDETPNQPADEHAVDIVAVAEMRDDGAIVVQVAFYTEAGTTGDALWEFPPEHPKYSLVFEYLGKPSVGESVTKDHWPYELAPGD